MRFYHILIVWINDMDKSKFHCKEKYLFMRLSLGEKGKVKILPVIEGEIREEYKDLMEYLEKEDIFTGKKGQMYSDVVYRGENVILLGLGKEKDLCSETLRNAFFKAGNELKAKKVEEATVIAERKYEDFCFKRTASAMAEGLIYSTYKYDRYRTMDRKEFEFSVKEIGFQVPEDKEEKISDALTETRNLMDGVFLARNLVNEPSEYMYPAVLAEEAKKALEPLGVEVEIKDRKEIEELGMSAFLAVAKGSSKEPKLIVMRWKGGNEGEDIIGLVGKGLTYDSGGYAIKPPTGMVGMHTDMGGSGAVIGAMKAIAAQKLPRNVTAVVCACENMISGDSYKNGDIIKSMSGKTIEIINTDAEGRVTLADALYYTAVNENASEIIDVATLTGAVIMALGTSYTGAVTNCPEMMEKVKNSADMAGEKIWQLPSDDSYREMIKGRRGDLVNQAPGGAGSITAGMFLENFVEKKNWVHMDIAGTADTQKAKGYFIPGATGTPVKTLYTYVKTSGEKRDKDK